MYLSICPPNILSTDAIHLCLVKPPSLHPSSPVLHLFNTIVWLAGLSPFPLSPSLKAFLFPLLSSSSLSSHFHLTTSFLTQQSYTFPFAALHFLPSIISFSSFCLRLLLLVISITAVLTSFMRWQLLPHFDFNSQSATPPNDQRRSWDKTTDVKVGELVTWGWLAQNCEKRWLLFCHYRVLFKEKLQSDMFLQAAIKCISWMKRWVFCIFHENFFLQFLTCSNHCSK